jgi:protein-S-isoprenylcysteine O-methyltransferase Ste14
MGVKNLSKIFGVGPIGALLSLSLLGATVWVDRELGGFPIADNPAPLRHIAAASFVLGAGVHIWTMITLRRWWKHDQLCTRGPFRYVRHPMYAGWITFVGLGVALLANSWLVVFLVAVLYPPWSVLVRKEERAMEKEFGREYLSYRRNTPCFIPRIFRL